MLTSGMPKKATDDFNIFSADNLSPFLLSILVDHVLQCKVAIFGHIRYRPTDRRSAINFVVLPMTFHQHIFTEFEPVAYCCS